MGIRPVACGGDSLGELTALYQAGAFDFQALLKLVSLRGQAMSSSTSPTGKPGAMAALFCSRETVNELIASEPGYAVVANINSPNQLVISGDGDAITAIVQKAIQRQISVVQLNVSNAFHSNYVTEAAEILRERSPISIQPERLDIDVFSCIDGQPLQSQVNLHDHLAQQVIDRVDFVSLIQNIEAHCDLLIEVGPGNVLAKLRHYSRTHWVSQRNLNLRPAAVRRSQLGLDQGRGYCGNGSTSARH
jgi:acyl transferase domain-containing protein